MASLYNNYAGSTKGVCASKNVINYRLALTLCYKAVMKKWLILQMAGSCSVLWFAAWLWYQVHKSARTSITWRTAIMLQSTASLQLFWKITLEATYMYTCTWTQYAYMCERAAAFLRIFLMKHWFSGVITCDINDLILQISICSLREWINFFRNTTCIHRLCIHVQVYM